MSTNKIAAPNVTDMTAQAQIGSKTKEKEIKKKIKKSVCRYTPTHG